jgi:deoxyribonuclease-4
MLIRKKALKIQERLGMRIGIACGTSKTPLVRTPNDVLNALRDLYRIGLKAFVLPPELFAGIRTTSDLYKTHYGSLLKIKDIANKSNIELSIHRPTFPDDPAALDEVLKTFSSIASIMDCRTFIIHPTFYKMIPQDQALRLVVYKINEIVSGSRTDVSIGVETTGRMNDVGSLEDVIDIVKRTRSTEPVINWAHIHARGSGALRTQEDFKRILDKVRSSIGSGWLQNAYFFFSGISYGPSGEIKHIPLSRSDINLEHLIKEIMSMNIKGTLIFEDPGKDKFILDMLDTLADMVR